MSTEFPRTLHIAAMPYPTYQGTQAAIHAMLSALQADRRTAHLVTYARGAFQTERSYPVERTPDFPKDTSFRSGPSVRKFALDAQLAFTASKYASKHSFDCYVAHHVEACGAALCARRRPTVFVAHTALALELPVYLPNRLRGLAREAGNLLDYGLVMLSDACCAVSPWLASRMEHQYGHQVSYLPVPWTIPDPIQQSEREAARTRWGFHQDDSVLLYAGNLDPYQGWELVVEAFAMLLSTRKNVRLLVATESDASPLLTFVTRCNVAHALTIAPLATEAFRRSVHAAADCCVVPRRVAGGIPIKLLDSMSRGVPVVAQDRATSSLALGESAIIVEDDNAEALAAAMAKVVTDDSGLRKLSANALAWIRQNHGPQAFVQAFDAACARARLRGCP